MSRCAVLVVAIGTFLSSAAFATTFVVPSDRDLIHRANAIVVAETLSSYTQLNEVGGIETVTSVSIKEVLKGTGFPDTIDIHEPGGQWKNQVMVIAGTPRFDQGKTMVLFLMATPVGTWAVWDLAVGKFDFAIDANGQRVAVRQESDLVGFDGDLTEHHERRRSLDAFLRFIRNEVKGLLAAEDYFVKASPLLAPPHAPAQQKPLFQANAVFTATSYSSDVDPAGTHQGLRWNVFPGAVSWFTGTTTEPGAPGGGVTAVQNAFAAWDGDAGSNVNYVYAGVDDGTHTGGVVGAADGRNTVLFERDLSSRGIAAFQCSSNSFSGVLGIGGPKGVSDATNIVSGEVFFRTTEADVEMNKGIANCTLLFNLGGFDGAVTHELGHTLGLRHADQTRANNPGVLCTTDPTLECVPPPPSSGADPPPGGTAIMRSFVTLSIGSTLQAWDQNAVGRIYPNVVVCTAPSITSQPTPSTAASGTQRTLNVSASGTPTLTYQWYTGTSGNTASPIVGAINSSLMVAPTTTTSYWVRVTNLCGSADSVTATATVGVGPFRGDANGNGIVDVPDVFFLINRLFSNGPAPATILAGDANNNGMIDVADIFFLINFLFSGGPAPAP